MSRALRGLALAVAALGTISCGNGLGLGTGLMGTMTRGPITPVCIEGVPCDAPFAAHFEVFRGSKLISAFDSDAGGQYSVSLAPGTYLIVPASNAPVMPQQSYGVDVRADAMTVVNLEFETGIR